MNHLNKTQKFLGSKLPRNMEKMNLITNIKYTLVNFRKKYWCKRNRQKTILFDHANLFLKWSMNLTKIFIPESKLPIKVEKMNRKIILKV
jgi:hypothetical protein